MAAILDAMRRTCGVAGGKDPDQALDDAADRATKALQDYNSRLGE